MERGAVLGFVLLGLWLGAAAAHADDWSKTYPVTGKPVARLHAGNAAITVEPGNNAEVSVDVTTNGLRIPGDVRIVESQTGNQIDVEVEQEHHGLDFATGSVRVNVRVPENTDLDVTTGNGKVRLDGIRGHLCAETGNGTIDARGLEGEILLRTGNGRVEAHGLAGRLEARTGNGEMSVSGRFTRLELESGRGSIAVVAKDGSRAATAWNLTSGTGSITLDLPRNFSGQLEASTGVGRISLDLPASVSRSLVGSSAQAKLGTGGETVAIRTGMGDIHIARASA
jgi:DUF4097 and DUF4098 domain-containing protein YvlB